MSLFHRRVIEKNLHHVEVISPQHEKILEKWADNIKKGNLDSETQNDVQFIQRIIVDILGYTGSDEACEWTVAKNQPVGKGNVDVALGFFDNNEKKIIAPFELKGAKTRDLDAIMPGRNKSPVQQAWEYAMDAKGAQWVLVSNYREIRLYAVGYGRKDYEFFDLSKMQFKDNYARLILLLSAKNLLGGKTKSLLLESEQVEKNITNQLYSDYKCLRNRMIKTIGKDNPGRKQLDIIRYTQKILDRILFVAFAEDKGLLPDKTLEKAYEIQNPFNQLPVWENFKGLFRAVDEGSDQLNISGYNGGLFKSDCELDSLIVNDQICEGFKKIGEYDFDSDVSVNILGHIFEQSITDIEELKAEVESDGVKFDKKKSKRKEDGVFYTPAYITRYIVEKTIGGWLTERRREVGFEQLPVLTDDDFASIKVIGKKKLRYEYNKKISSHISAWEAYKQKVSEIKVIDPACGSGAFLNEVFDFLKKEGVMINNELSKLTGNQTDLFRWETHILTNNIYGIDLNQESTEITKLSLWLKTANKNEKLSYLDGNIKVGNALINDQKVAGDLAFEWNKAFPEILERGGFDIVIGNPPWGAKLNDRERSFLKAENSDVIVRTLNTYMVFVNRALKISKRGAYNGWVVPDSILFQPHNKKLRDCIVLNNSLKEVVSLGNAFKDVAQPCAIFIFSKEPTLEYSSVKMLDISNSSDKAEVLSNSDFSNIDSCILKDLPGSIWPTKNAESYFLLKKVDCKLSDYLDCDGIQRGVSPDLKEAFIVDNEAVDRKMLERDYVRPTVSGGRDVKRFYIPVCEKNIIYTSRKDDPEKFPNIVRHILSYKDSIACKEVEQGKHPIYALHRSRSESIFNKDKKIVGVITGDKIIAAVDEVGLYPTDGLYVFCVKNYTLLDCFVAILNSSLITYMYRLLSGEVGRQMSQVKPSILSEIPFPDISVNCGLVVVLNKLGLEMKKLVTEIDFISDGFVKLFSADMKIAVAELKKDLYLHSFSEFIEIVEKIISPQKFTLSKKEEWMPYFESGKKKYLSVISEANRINRKIDETVYMLYGLNAHEIEIVENNL